MSRIDDKNVGKNAKIDVRRSFRGCCWIFLLTCFEHPHAQCAARYRTISCTSILWHLDPAMWQRDLNMETKTTGLHCASHVERRFQRFFPSNSDGKSSWYIVAVGPSLRDRHVAKIKGQREMQAKPLKLHNENMKHKVNRPLSAIEFGWSYRSVSSYTTRRTVYFV